MKHDGNESKINIFVASSGELNDERKEMIPIVHAVNKLFPHLTLDVIEWETDIPSGSYDKQRVQDEINPYLEESRIVIVIFFSKLGRFTLEEYNLAIEKKKKVFLYFKQGFSTNIIEEHKSQQKVLEFRKRIETENKTLYRDYHTIDQFKYFIRDDLGLYLKEEFSPKPSVGTPAIPKYLTALPVKSVQLEGREFELEEMTRLLGHAHRVLLVNGLGGVGKTELCKRYFQEHGDVYRHLAWVDVVGSVRESVVAAFKAEATGCCADDTVDERFEKIMDLLVGLDTHCLLVADNIENPGDPDLERLRALPVKVIANSRLSLDRFERFTLDFLSAEGCKRLFYNFYTGKRDDGHVEKIVGRCGRHTLSVELLAKTAEHGAMPLKDLYEVLEKKGFDLTGVIDFKVPTSRHGDKEETSFFKHLLKIFDLSQLTDDERFILTNLSVLPPMYIEIGDVRDWLKLTDHEAVNSLVVKGWLRKEAGGFGIFMHQVIQEVVRYHTSPDEKTCKNLIVSLTRKLYLKPGENPMDKKRYIIFAETLLRTIDKTDESLATLSNNLSLRFRDLGSLKKALEFQLKALNIREQVLDKKHPSLATSYNNVSAIYKDLGQPEKALEFQLKALNIKEQVLDKKHPDLATSYNNVSTIYKDLGQPEKALEFQLKDKNILEQVLDKKHPSLAGSYNNVSLIYNALGQPEKALEFQLKALNIKEQVLDKKHPSLATSYNNLAMIYEDLKDYESAKTYGEKAVAILQHLFPKGHPNLDAAKRNLEGIKEEGRGTRDEAQKTRRVKKT